MIRLAEERDREDFLRLARLAHRESSYSMLVFEDKMVNDVLDKHLQSDKSRLIVIVDTDEVSLKGIIVGIVGPSIFGSDLIGSELCWYAEGGDKRVLVNLFRTYEAWCQHVGCRVYTKGKQVHQGELLQVRELRN